MNCDQVLNRLSDYLEQALDPKDAAAVETHLGACSACRSESDALARSMRGVAELAEIEPPANLARNVMAQVREEAEEPTLWRRLFFPLHIKVPVQAMAVLLVSGLAVYIYMTAERSQVEILQDQAASRAPMTAMDAKEENRAVKPSDIRFAQEQPRESMREAKETAAKGAASGKEREIAKEFRKEVEVARDTGFAAPQKKTAVSRVPAAKAPKPPERAPMRSAPETRKEAALEEVLREEAPAESGAEPESDVAAGTLEALIDAGRARATKSGPAAAWPEATLKRELELLFAPSQGGAGDANTRESLALLVEQLGGRLTAADPAQLGTALSRKAAPHIFWVSLPENRYDRFRTELSARGIITPASAPVPSPTESESPAESPWVRIKLTVETPQ
jgi:hypothetical protein